MCQYANVGMSEYAYVEIIETFLIGIFAYWQIGTFSWPRSTMDSIRASEAPDTGSIPVEATKSADKNC